MYIVICNTDMINIEKRVVVRNQHKNIITVLAVAGSSRTVEATGIRFLLFLLLSLLSGRDDSFQGPHLLVGGANVLRPGVTGCGGVL